jgi:hypothetical protein
MYYTHVGRPYEMRCGIPDLSVKTHAKVQGKA